MPGRGPGRPRVVPRAPAAGQLAAPCFMASRIVGHAHLGQNPRSRSLPLPILSAAARGGRRRRAPFPAPNQHHPTCYSPSLVLPRRLHTVARLPSPAGAEQQRRRRPDQSQHAADARQPLLEPSFLFKSTRVSTPSIPRPAAGQVRRSPAGNLAAGEVSPPPGTTLQRFDSFQGSQRKIPGTRL
jgi:hypothetical protein